MNIIQYLPHGAAALVAVIILVAIMGIALAERHPTEEAEDREAMRGASGATDGESDAERHLRQSYVQRRDRIFMASRRERAEMIAKKNQVRE